MCQSRHMGRVDFNGWLNEIELWIESPPRRMRRWREKLDGVQGIVEVRHHQLSGMTNANYLIHSPAFDRLVYGKISNGGMLNLICGMAREPYRQAIAVPGDTASVRHLIDTIGAEAQGFFRMFRDLPAVYSELSAPEARCPRLDPRSPSLRQMHAAAVAFLIGEKWEPHIQGALAGPEPRISSDWVLEVKARIEAAT